MDSKTDIGKLFRDGLSQLDKEPNSFVWENIENNIAKKKKTKFAPFWFIFPSFILGGLFTYFVVKNDENLLINKHHNTEEKNRNTLSKFTNKPNSLENKTNIQQQNNNIYNKVDNEQASSENAITNQNRKLKTENYNINDGSTSLNQIQKNKKTKLKNLKNLSIKIKNLETENNLLKNEIISLVQRDLTKNNIEQKNNESKKEIIENKLTTLIDTLKITEIKKPIPQINTKENNDSITKKDENDKVEVAFTPYMGLGLFNNDNFSLVGNFKTIENNFVTNLHYGILYKYMVNKNYGIQTGIGFINKSTSKTLKIINNQNIVINNNNINTSNIDFDKEDTFKVNHYYNIVEIPLEFVYKSNFKKFGYGIATGLSLMFVNENIIQFETTNKKINLGSYDKISNQNFSLNIKPYAFYSLSKNLDLELTPTLQYQFLNNLKDEKLNGTIISVRLGLNYKF